MIVSCLQKKVWIEIIKVFEIVKGGNMEIITDTDNEVRYFSTGYLRHRYLEVVRNVAATSGDALSCYFSTEHKINRDERVLIDYYTEKAHESLYAAFRASTMKYYSCAFSLPIVKSINTDLSGNEKHHYTLAAIYLDKEKFKEFVGDETGVVDDETGTLVFANALLANIQNGLSVSEFNNSPRIEKQMSSKPRVCTDIESITHITNNNMEFKNQIIKGTGEHDKSIYNMATCLKYGRVIIGKNKV